MRSFGGKRSSIRLAVAASRRSRLTQQTRGGQTPAFDKSMANGRCRMHGGPSPGAPKGNANSLKHGRFTAEAIAERRMFAALVRDMKGVVKQIENDE